MTGNKTVTWGYPCEGCGHPWRVHSLHRSRAEANEFVKIGGPCDRPTCPCPKYSPRSQA